MRGQDSTDKQIGIVRTLGLVAITLLFAAPIVDAQSVQTINTETQLGSILCRNPADEATNGHLLNEHSQLVTVTLWHTLIKCALSPEAEQVQSRSIEIYKVTLNVADRLNKDELVAATYYHMGQTYSVSGDFENSLRAYETSRKFFEEIGVESNVVYVMADLGALYLTAGDFEKAQSYSEQGLTKVRQIRTVSTTEFLGPIEYGQARSLHTLGEIDLNRGNHEVAIQKLVQALALYEQLNGAGSSYNTQTSQLLVTLAKVYGEMGQYGRALSYLNRARQIARHSGDQNTFANTLNSLGSLLLEQDDHAGAQPYFQQSLVIYRSTRNEREHARVLLNLAVVKYRQGEHDDALRLFHQSMASAKSIKLLDVQISAGQGVGVVLTAKRDFRNALDAVNQSLDLAQQVNAKTREVELLCTAAQIHYEMKSYSESAALAEQAGTLARSLRLAKLIYMATAALGEAYAADNRVDLAIATLRESIDQVEALRNRVAGRQEGLYLFFEDKVGPYHTLVKLLTGQGKHFEALVYAERAKGRMLLEAVRTNRIDLKDFLRKTERIEAERLINNLSVISEQIQSNSVNGSTDELNTRLKTARRELVSFQERLAAAHPELRLRTGAVQPLTHANLNTLIPATDVAYLEFVITSDDVGLFVLKRNGVKSDPALKYIHLTINPDELRHKVNEFHLALAERHPGYDALGHELYRSLIEPAANELQNITTVCVIPDAFLWTLPFQALITPRGNYLLQEYSLYSAPSLSVLNEMALRRPQQTSKESVIAFGNPVIERNAQLKQDLHPLPEAEAEVAAVSLTARTKMKKIFVGRRADERTFKNLAPQYATIHLATHGVLDNEDPLNSYLLLTKADGEWENEGRLHAREIMNMQLNADLAVLSACETGNGRISPAEGVVGMSWAFLVAGTRSVVVSQWRVNSASTSQFMKGFYQALSKHHDPSSRKKSQALREASLRLLNDSRYRHPFYWAGFVLVSSN